MEYGLISFEVNFEQMKKSGAFQKDPITKAVNAFNREIEKQKLNIKCHGIKLKYAPLKDDFKNAQIIEVDGYTMLTSTFIRLVELGIILQQESRRE